MIRFIFCLQVKHTSVAPLCIAQNAKRPMWEKPAISEKFKRCVCVFKFGYYFFSQAFGCICLLDNIPITGRTIVSTHIDIPNTDRTMVIIHIPNLEMVFLLLFCVSFVQENVCIYIIIIYRVFHLNWCKLIMYGNAIYV